MEYRNFGRTGLRVSALCYGAMTIDRDDCHNGVNRSLLHALEAGVNCIDTARAYGPSEEIIAKTLKEWTGPKPLLFTKVAPLPTGDWRFYGPLERAFTPASIRESVEASLRALQVDRLDLLQLHQWYYRWLQQPEWLETFRALQREGKIRFYGVSAQDHEHDAVLRLAEDRLVDSLQTVFGIFESRPATSLLPVAQQHGIAVIARGVLEDGTLTTLMTDDAIRQHPRLGPQADQFIARRRQLAKLAAAHDLNLETLAIRFALSQPEISTLTLSMSRRAYVDLNVAAAQGGPLPEPLVTELLREHVWVKNMWYANWPNRPAA